MRWFTHQSFNNKHMKKRIKKAKFLNEAQKTEDVDEALERAKIKRPQLAAYLLENDFKEALEEIAPVLTASALGRIVDICTGTDSGLGAETRYKAACKLLDVFGKDVTGIEFSTAIKKQELANKGQKDSILAMLDDARTKAALEMAKKNDVFTLIEE